MRSNPTAPTSLALVLLAAAPAALGQEAPAQDPLESALGIELAKPVVLPDDAVVYGPPAPPAVQEPDAPREAPTPAADTPAADDPAADDPIPGPQEMDPNRLLVDDPPAPVVPERGEDTVEPAQTGPVVIDENEVAVPLDEADGGRGELEEALLGGRYWVDLRYRFEAAEVRPFLRRSWASTFRTAAGYETGSYRGFRLLGEIESVNTVLGNQYFDAVDQRNNERAPVFDPEDTEINQLYLSYSFEDEPLDLRVGRQEIELGNGRFISAEPWRQNHRSFDGLRAMWEANDRLEVDYTYAFQVNGVLGSDGQFGGEGLNSHFLDVRYGDERYGDFGAYAILNDLDDTETLSSSTLGARWERDFDAGKLRGRDVVLNGSVEYAKQTDAFGNPVDVDADYSRLHVSAERGALQVLVGRESLGGGPDAGDRFTTPFADLQSFNGYADVFRLTPDRGLVDLWFEVSQGFTMPLIEVPTTFRFAYHDFDAESGGQTYGRELDFDLLAEFSERFHAGLRYADFDGSGDGVFRNANRFMAWVSYRVF